MSFSHSLYYPHIDVLDREFLVNAALFWEKVSTIVPKSYQEPYRLNDTRALADVGIIAPLRIEPNSLEIREIGREALEYFHTPQATSVLLPDNVHLRRSWEFDELQRSTIYLEKMSDELIRDLLETGQARQLGNRLEMSFDFANYYMTLLAARLSRRRGLALLTTTQKYEDLSNEVRRGDRSFVNDEGSELAVGLLASLVINSLKIDPDTSVKDIIRFREKHRDELARFRYEINRLVAELNGPYESIAAMQQHVSALYSDQINPAISDLRAGLKASNIRTLVSTITTIAFCSPAFSAFAGSMDPGTATIALFAGMGASVIANKVGFRLDRQQELRQNPYSYVLALERRFS